MLRIWLSLILPLLLLWLCALANTASAHGLVPMLLKVEQHTATAFTVSLKSGVPQTKTPTPAFPPGCRVSSPRRTQDASAHWAVWALRCAEPPAALRLPGLGDYQAVAQFHDGQGLRHSTLLTAHAPTFTFADNGASFIGNLGSGVVHLLAGWDHLLFVIGLTLWLRRGKPLLLAITSFTVGHSLTLALAATGVLTVPVALAELAIAATLLYLALQLSRGAAARARHMGTGTVVILPLAFGLLHGLGFANVLNAQGLAGGDLALTLLGFNLGLELAQLLVVAGLLLTLLLMQRHAHRLQTAAVYAIGSLSVFWMWERAVLLTV